MKHVIIAYHAASLDGFTGAWAFWHYWRNVYTLTTIAATQKTVAPDVKDAEVYMVGFVYARGCVRRLLENGCTVYMVGNHRSAEVDLRARCCCNTLQTHISICTPCPIVVKSGRH